MPDATPTPAVRASRIGIRAVAGVAEFYDTGSGERFVPRGVNYIEFHRTERGHYEDRVLATDVYDSERVRTEFRRLAGVGYNSVRVFFDTCSFGPSCLGAVDSAGLNPAYLDNMADLMRIAAEEGIYVIWTANALPDDGGYLALFDRELNRAPHPGFEGWENADWLHRAAIVAKGRLWDDLLGGLTERAAPFEAVLGWQLTNEFWLHADRAPMSLDSGTAETANGRSYDLADPDQKRRMVVDGVLHFVAEMRAIIERHDPEGLVTMGFFAPRFPNPTGTGGDTYVDTAPLLEAADLDFFDFHAYYDSDLGIRALAENFGMIGFESKPVIMGETGSGKAYLPSAVGGLAKGLAWYAESCDVGFDGWLNWGHFPWPRDVAGAAWALLDADGLLFHGLSPAEHPDPCVVPELEVTNVAWQRPARASSALPDQPAALAVDGGEPAWNAGEGAPQWLEITLDSATAIDEVALAIEQWPPGPTQHRVWATRVDGGRVLLADLETYTTPDAVLTVTLARPLPGVEKLRIETARSPSWVGWKEVTVRSAREGGPEPCLVEGGQVRARPAADATVVGRLRGGELAYAEGLLESADGWWRLPGDRWLQAAADSCADAPTIAGPRLELVPVTFVVQLPTGTNDAFIAGDFGAASLLPVWAPYAVFLDPASGARRNVVVPLPLGAEIQYVYTRGSFGNAECPNPRDPRVALVEPGLVIEDIVEGWRGEDC